MCASIVAITMRLTHVFHLIVKNFNWKIYYTNTVHSAVHVYEILYCNLRLHTQAKTHIYI